MPKRNWTCRSARTITSTTSALAIKASHPFLHGRRWFVFKVVVPKDWPVDKRVVWTLTTNGRTDQAKGWLQPEWEVDNPLITKNAVTDRTIGIWETEEIEGNQPPTVTGQWTSDRHAPRPCHSLGKRHRRRHPQA